MKFIKLTLPEDDVAAYINIDHIACFVATKKGTAIIFSDDKTEIVKETLEEILELIENAEKPKYQCVTVKMPERFGR